MFPRSQGIEPGKGATFDDCIARLPEIARLGFDVVYLVPIHPIGRVNRKGKDNSTVAEPDDPGSPYAIGSEEGGHRAVDPELGTLADFRRFVRAAAALGMEVALDFAIQAAPDHPWVREHPQWFRFRPDGTIKYSENPPKKYQDIVNVDFNNPDREGLWNELRDTLLFWVGEGVRAFRVDNPHTKPLPFWEWLIREVKASWPEAIFLSEAFTRPKMMRALAKAGFSQSYTYFTWRNTKAELTEYLTELAQGPAKEYFRPNFFTNTPDILPVFLQEGGRPAFRIRLTLAGTLSPAYGIYNGFELCENAAITGREEYIHSEKYEYKVWDWDRPGNIKRDIAILNRFRRENPAVQELTNLRFLDCADPNLLAYAKATANRSNIVIAVVNLERLTSMLEYLLDLGVTALLLLPFYPSTMRDDGYDIADYRNIHPAYGRMPDFSAFVLEAHRRRLRIITELVINHPSDQHPWFQRARRARPGSTWRDFYVWSDTDQKFLDTRIIFLDTEKSNWSWDPVAQAYYWHRFYSHQPDLNFDNPHVFRAITNVMRYWLDLGVDGMRLDAVPYLIEREGAINENLPETHEILKRLRCEMDRRYGDRMLLAEANQWPEDVLHYFVK